MIDTAKLERLHRHLRRDRAAMREMGSEVRLMHEDVRLLKHRVVEDMRPTRKWDQREDLAELMRLPPDELAALGVDVKAADAALTLRRAAAEIQLDIDALSVETAALSQLVARLDAYAKGAAA